MKVVKHMSRADLAQHVAAGGEHCCMDKCFATATHAIVIEAHGDNSTMAVMCCEPHYKFLLAELSKRDDHLYTKYVTGAELIEDGTQ